MDGAIPAERPGIILIIAETLPAHRRLNAALGLMS
jgi:hypothetical protein